MNPVLNKTEALIAGVVLAVLEAVQIAFIHLPGGVHDAISLAVIVIAGLGVAPLAPSAIKRLIPIHIAAWLTASAGILEVVQRTQFGIGETLHAILGAVIVLLATIGITPVTASHPPAAQRRAGVSV